VALVTTADHSSELIRSLVAASANEARSAFRFAARSASIVQCGSAARSREYSVPWSVSVMVR
jgi:hypothetical protein